MDLRLCTGIRGGVPSGGRGEHEVGSVGGVGVQAVAVEAGCGGGLAGGMSRRKFRIRSCVDSTGLSCSGVRVGDRLKGRSGEREEGGLFGSVGAVAGWFWLA